jgi:hypothetical protein
MGVDGILNKMMNICWMSPADDVGGCWMNPQGSTERIRMVVNTL